MGASELLATGVAHGIITAEQAERLRALEIAAEPDERAASPDDEQLRFISGFSDIFVTIGLGMFLGALGYFVDRAAGHVAMWASVALVAWGLAEFFTRMRRMALPSIVLLLTFAGAVFMAAGITLGAGAPLGPGLAGIGGKTSAQALPLAGAALATVALTAAHYWRFRVPITIAAGCAALTGAVIGLVYGAAPQLTLGGHLTVVFLCGLAIFALAMRFDMTDPERRTRRTDIAFWLHLLAAPLIVHSLIRGQLNGGATLQSSSAATVIAAFLVLSLIAVLIDRRAMMVSGLSYAGYAFAALIGDAGPSDITTPATILVLGAFVLLLSAGWRPLRAAILRLTPAALSRHLPAASRPG